MSVPSAMSVFSCPSVPPISTRDARANAAIISPFHAVSTLSSSCGRGRSSRTSNSSWRERSSDSATSTGDLPLDARDVGNRLRRVEQVLVDELLLRIERRVAVRQNAVARFEHQAASPKLRANLLRRPDVEGAFHLVRALRIVDASRAGCCRRPRRNRSRRFVGHVAPHVLQRVFGDLREERIAAGLRTLRDTPARAAPGRRASSRNAARASCRPPSSGGSRRRCGRACRRAPSTAASARPSRAHIVAGSLVLAQQEQQLARSRKLRRVAEAAAPGVEGLLKLLQRLGQRGLARRTPIVLALGHRGQAIDNLRRRLHYAEGDRHATRGRFP